MLLRRKLSSNRIFHMDATGCFVKISKVQTYMVYAPLMNYFLVIKVRIQLNFKFSPASSDNSSSSTSRRRRGGEEHASTVELLNGLLFKGQPTAWRLDNNAPRREVDAPKGDQFILDRDLEGPTSLL